MMKWSPTIVLFGFENATIMDVVIPAMDVSMIATWCCKMMWFGVNIEGKMLQVNLELVL